MRIKQKFCPRMPELNTNRKLRGQGLLRWAMRQLKTAHEAYVTMCNVNMELRKIIDDLKTCESCKYYECSYFSMPCRTCCKNGDNLSSWEYKQ